MGNAMEDVEMVSGASASCGVVVYPMQILETELGRWIINEAIA